MKRGILRFPFYVCADSHWPRNLLLKCGAKVDYFCKSWDFETTGDTYWKPSSSGNLLHLKQDILTLAPTISPLKQVVNTLNLAQKDGVIPSQSALPPQGCKQEGCIKGYTWGLSIYHSGPDGGLLFTNKLLKEFPYRPVAIVPNPALGGHRPTNPGTNHQHLHLPYLLPHQG